MNKTFIYLLFKIYKNSPLPSLFQIVGQPIYWFYDIDYSEDGA